MLCEDVPLGDPSLIAFLDDSAREGWPSDWRWGSVSFIEGLRMKGCAFLRDPAEMLDAISSLGGLGYPPNIMRINACAEGGLFFPVKPLSYFCPATCGCHAGDKHCPDTCPPRNATSHICPEAQRLARQLPSVGVSDVLERGT
jgi:hypothetical protein